MFQVCSTTILKLIEYGLCSGYISNILGLFQRSDSVYSRMAGDCGAFGFLVIAKGTNSVEMDLAIG